MIEVKVFDGEDGAMEGKEEPGRELISHLGAEIWAEANELLVRKAIAEFAHELLIHPEWESGSGAGQVYCLAAQESGVVYHFRGRVLALDHWHIEPGSLVKSKDGAEVGLDAMEFILEFRDALGLSASILPVYMEEITGTLYALAYLLAHRSPSCEQLVGEDFQEIEHAMVAGHPCFVANSGRIGFGAAEYRAFAPEAAGPIRFVWVAADKRRANYASVGGLDYESLLESELDSATREELRGRLSAKGRKPEDYFLMPVHPWQWNNKVTRLFAADLARGDLVHLGTAGDSYLPQQSIRTFFNVSQPERSYVKTSLSILNMGFMRGLSPYYMRTAPAINEWIYEKIASDGFFTEKGFSILREVASIGYGHDYYERATDKESAYRKMLAALWRESPVTRCGKGERLMTMAALLHLDREGGSFLLTLIRRSDVDITEWIRRFLDCYLAPFLHLFYRYDLVFMPHGENIILVLENNRPVRAILKDISEDVALFDPEAVLPEKVRRLAVSVPEHLKVLSIFTDIFDSVLRFVAHILVCYGGYPEERFWGLVSECIEGYQEAHPDLHEKFERYDLFAPEFSRSCLNRLQLRNNQQLIDLSDPSANLQFAGTLQNPVATCVSRAIFPSSGG